ncbi:hypothetical protein TNCV_2950181 [Trichonephila clavipes]|nr:hypothetical protein TNCV_2950181 [Trichonephila clavipes]
MKEAPLLHRTHSSSGARSRRARLKIHESFVFLGAISGHRIFYFSVEVSGCFHRDSWSVIPLRSPSALWFSRRITLCAFNYFFLAGGGDFLVGLAITFVLVGELLFDVAITSGLVGVTESELSSSCSTLY